MTFECPEKIITGLYLYLLGQPEGWLKKILPWVWQDCLACWQSLRKSLTDLCKVLHWCSFSNDFQKHQGHCIWIVLCKWPNNQKSSLLTQDFAWSLCTVDPVHVCFVLVWPIGRFVQAFFVNWDNWWSFQEYEQKRKRNIHTSVRTTFAAAFTTSPSPFV